MKNFYNIFGVLCFYYQFSAYLNLNTDLSIYLSIYLQKLDEQDFGEKKNINKRKKLIEAGEVCIIMCFCLCCHVFMTVLSCVYDYFIMCLWLLSCVFDCVIMCLWLCISDVVDCVYLVFMIVLPRVCDCIIKFLWLSCHVFMIELTRVYDCVMTCLLLYYHVFMIVLSGVYDCIISCLWLYYHVLMIVLSGVYVCIMTCLWLCYHVFMIVLSCVYDRVIMCYDCIILCDVCLWAGLLIMQYNIVIAISSIANTYSVIRRVYDCIFDLLFWQKLKWNLLC